MAPARVVEPHEVATPRVVRAHLADQPVAEGQELRAPVQAALAGLRVVPRHRPLDDDLVLALDEVLDPPHGAQVLDGQPRVLTDLGGADSDFGGGDLGGDLGGDFEPEPEPEPEADVDGVGPDDWG